MKFEPKNVQRSINKAFLKEPVERKKFNAFKDALGRLINEIDQSEQAGEQEEHFKNLLPPFFKAIGFGEYKINTSSNIDLAIYTGSKTKDPLGVLMEIKRPSNKPEMISKERLNRKAMHEAVLYYLEQRIEQENDDLKHIIITDMNHWFIFDAQEFERCFYRPSTLRKAYKEWKADQKVSSGTDFMYNQIASFIGDSDATISGISLPLKPVSKLLEAKEGSDYEKRLISLYKFFSPIHLLKEPFANDSNSLNKEFYRELLYILGLEETKEGSTRYIRRAEEKNRHSGSIIENTIRILDAEDHLSTLKNARSSYGANRNEQLFSVAMELGITWMNRILFLKLLEAQLYRYHRKDRKFKFLNFATIDSLDELNKLFFQVLARKEKDRSDDVIQKFGHIPYLNSSLFDVSDLEHQTTRISGLDDHAEMPVYSKSVLNDSRGETLNTLDYLFRFLEAYDFSAEGSEEIRDESKSLINASVLGLIFEKINGYKDGSFYTPGFITEYMARETLRKSVVDKFNDTFDWTCENLDDLQEEIHRDRIPYDKANAVINGLTVCDPAVGSGHFLVSCLNELIAIKSELRILCDTKLQVLRGVEVTVENDELMVSWEDEGLFEYDVSHTWKGDKLASRYVSSDRERVQKTLFHEKRYLIENCLFGVDINPNSVKICRLRLWIELLKRAYYTRESDYMELEVLPNIDINIKQGNSLVSRFELDSDLNFVFKNSGYTLDDYKEAVRNYKETGDRDEKKRLKLYIDDVKKNFVVGLQDLHPERKKLKLKEAKVVELTTQFDMFGDEIEGEAGSRKVRIKMAEEELQKQKEKVEALEEGEFYNQSFEWRFEFPEVLDDEGLFTGFDIVIGNPPYGVSLSKPEKQFFKQNYNHVEYQIDSYILFIEKGSQILKSSGYLYFIIPNTWMTNITYRKIRDFMTSKVNVIEVLHYEESVFKDAVVDTQLVLINKKTQNTSNLTSVKIVGESNKKSFEYLVDQSQWQSSNSDPINIYLDPELLKLAQKIDRPTKLKKLVKITQGVKPFQVGKGNPKQTRKIVNEKPFVSETKKNDSFRPLLAGKLINKYTIIWDNNYWISFGDWLAEPRYSANFDANEKIIVRQTGDSLIAAYDDSKFIVRDNLYVAVPLDKANVKYLLAVINSKVMNWYYQNVINPEKGEALAQVKKGHLVRLPIIEASKENQESIAKLSSRIINMKNQNPEADTAELEAEIDRLVYELYGLSEEEIGVVEGVLD